jgi:hypothetical protein
MNKEALGWNAVSRPETDFAEYINSPDTKNIPYFFARNRNKRAGRLVNVIRASQLDVSGRGAHKKRR